MKEDESCWLHEIVNVKLKSEVLICTYTEQYTHIYNDMTFTNNGHSLDLYQHFDMIQYCNSSTLHAFAIVNIIQLQYNTKDQK